MLEGEIVEPGNVQNGENGDEAGDNRPEQELVGPVVAIRQLRKHLKDHGWINSPDIMHPLGEVEL